MTTFMRVPTELCRPWVFGNLIARVLMDQGFNVTCTDIKTEDECRFRYTLEPYIKKYSTTIYAVFIIFYKSITSFSFPSGLEYFSLQISIF